ncbi:MAG: DUF3108 domain-containing protein [Bryobacterales bacterium]|nr:DUF3108 domain-containing protein [Bryobacterales bacterium]
MILRIALAATLVSFAAPATALAQQPGETLNFGIEWRFVRAGDAQVKWSGDSRAELVLRTTGIVASLYSVLDTYHSTYDPGLCITAISLEAHEGRRNRDVKVTFDREKKRAHFLEKDLNTGATATNKEIDVPACAHDVMGGLHKLRQLRPAIGKSVELPISDGKKIIMAKVEAQQRETITTPLGQFSAIRYEAFLFNGVFYGRKGRLLIWITEDEKRLPIQVRIQLPFYVGTITLQLEKTQ